MFKPHILTLTLVATAACTSEHTPVTESAPASAQLHAATTKQKPAAHKHDWTPKKFHLEEATISEIHGAIRHGELTCQKLVQLYVDRAKAYNGVCNQIISPDGAPIPEAHGPVRAGSPLAFPTETKAITSFVPSYDQYTGTPLELGHMESTASDPSVKGQYGMTVGIPNAGQVNALGTVNLRGERSVTCKAECDLPPSAGPLPDTCPAVCEEFRAQPDALERAAELDAQYGSAPDLDAMPMYCIPFSFKDPYDTKDMRSTAGADAAYDIDFPARDHTLVAQLREKGAIIYAKAVLTEYNGRAGDPGGKNEPNEVLLSTLGYQRSTWGGNPCNPYDTTRAASLGSSSGSGASVSTNLVMCSLCEETRASCRGPANHNSVALILPHKALLSFLGGAIGSDVYNDRAGVHCRTVGDAARVLDALRDPQENYYDSRDVFTTVARSSVLEHYADDAAMDGRAGSLRGMRIGVIRESMLKFPGVKADEPIVDAVSDEIKTVLGDYLGATLVESVDPRWEDDPEIENMKPSYTSALTQLLPLLYPDLLFCVNGGKPQFPEFAAAITPTEFEPGMLFGTGTKAPVDYMLDLAEGAVPPPATLNIRSIQNLSESRTFRFHFPQYARRRAADWAARGYTETLVDFPTLNARSKFWGDDQRAAFKNWEEVTNIRAPLGQRQGVDERVKLRELLRRVEMKVIQENHLDVVVRLHTSLPPGQIGLASQPGPAGDTRGETPMGPNQGLTEVLIPAGYVRTAYDPRFALSEDGLEYDPVPNDTEPTTIPAPGLPFSLVFRAEEGMENRILKAASAYEAASHRRVPPPSFGPLPNEP
ncbi:MAG TPA: amidase family protein [Polyangiales bacterium]|nr:amidase family protein [Polyangiales bacterium]